MKFDDPKNCATELMTRFVGFEIDKRRVHGYKRSRSKTFYYLVTPEREYVFHDHAKRGLDLNDLTIKLTPGDEIKLCLNLSDKIMGISSKGVDLLDAKSFRELQSIKRWALHLLTFSFITMAIVLGLKLIFNWVP